MKVFVMSYIKQNKKSIHKLVLSHGAIKYLIILPSI